MVIDMINIDFDKLYSDMVESGDVATYGLKSTEHIKSNFNRNYKTMCHMGCFYAFIKECGMYFKFKNPNERMCYILKLLCRNDYCATIMFNMNWSSGLWESMYFAVSDYES